MCFGAPVIFISEFIWYIITIFSAIKKVFCIVAFKCFNICGHCGSIYILNPVQGFSAVQIFMQGEISLFINVLVDTLLYVHVPVAGQQVRTYICTFIYIIIHDYTNVTYTL